MSGRGLSRASALVFAVCAISFGVDDDAFATTFCVPGFSTACPNSGGNVAQSDLEKAMGLQAEDGQADEVRLAAGTFTEAAAPYEPAGGSGETLEPEGSDPLTVIGAGPAATTITSAATANVFIVNLAFNNSRAITMKDLTIRVPAAVPDGLGAAIQMAGDTLEDADIVSLNKDSDGIASPVGPGNVFRGGEVRGEGGGSIGDGLNAGASGGSLLVEDAVVRDASWALEASGAGSSLSVRRTDVVGARTYGAIAVGGTLAVENSRMTIDDGVGLYAGAGTDPAFLKADHVTIVDSGGSNPAVEAIKLGPTAGKTTLSVASSILRGFATGYKAQTPIGPGVGTVSLGIRYSDLPVGGSNTNGTLDLATGNIDVDPQLNADFSLPPTSPSIDAGDPGAGSTEDFAGAPRPRDGNGDGIAIGDQGAFEYQPPSQNPPPPPTPGPGDIEPPQTSITKGPAKKKLAVGKATFRFRSSEPGSSFVCKLDKRQAKPCRSPKSYTGLKPGRHLFKVWATDAAGNKDRTPAKRRFTVPAA